MKRNAVCGVVVDAGRASLVSPAGGLPWGVNIGGVGLPPYLPLPSKLRTRVLADTEALPDEDADAYAERVHDLMQRALTEMTANRGPLLN